MPEEYLGDGPYQPEDAPVPRVFKGIAAALIIAALGLLIAIAAHIPVHPNVPFTAARMER